MAYIPPAPGATQPGQPTPVDVPKQDVHITDLPPEVRKSFLMSMVFFPSLIGAAVCLVMFLGWVTIFKPKESKQYALELTSSDMRRRLVAERELAEHIRPFGEKLDSQIYSPEVVAALLQILDNPDLDQEALEWSPSNTMRKDDERASQRQYAAYILGHIAAQMPDPEHERVLKALLKALDQNPLTLHAIRGLALCRDPGAIEPLVKHLNEDTDAGLRHAAAEALGSIGFKEMMSKDGFQNADKVRNALKTAFQNENAKAKRDELLLDNLAIALARVKDSTGKARLEALEKDEDMSNREQARRALEILNTPLPDAGAAKPLVGKQ